MARKVYHVVPAGSMWHVKLAKTGAVVGNHYDKQSAVNMAVSTAKQNMPSQVVVHRMDGTIETEWTYGNDPYPPIG